MCARGCAAGSSGAATGEGADRSPLGAVLQRVWYAFSDLTPQPPLHEWRGGRSGTRSLEFSLIAPPLHSWFTSGHISRNDLDSGRCVRWMGARPRCPRVGSPFASTHRRCSQAWGTACGLCIGVQRLTPGNIRWSPSRDAKVARGGAERARPRPRCGASAATVRAGATVRPAGRARTATAPPQATFASREGDHLMLPGVRRCTPMQRPHAVPQALEHRRCLETKAFPTRGQGGHRAIHRTHRPESHAFREMCPDVNHSWRGGWG